MKLSNRVAALAIAFGLTGLAAQAGPITLYSNDGTVTLTGDLVALQDGFYFVKTVFGELLISADWVTCSGSACITVQELQIAMNG